MFVAQARQVSVKNRRVALLSAASAVAMVVGAAAPQQARAGEYYWAGVTIPNVYNLFSDQRWLKRDGSASSIAGASSSGDVFHFEMGFTIINQDGGINGLITFVSDTTDLTVNWQNGSLSGDANAKIKFTGAGKFLLNTDFAGFAGSIDIDATTVSLGRNRGLPTDGLITVTNNATLDLGARSHELKSLTLDSGTLRNGTLSAGSAVTSRGGTIDGIVATGIALTTNSGTTNLTGTSTFGDVTVKNTATLTLYTDAGQTLKLKTLTVDAGGTLIIGANGKGLTLENANNSDTDLTVTLGGTVKFVAGDGVNLSDSRINLVDKSGTEKGSFTKQGAGTLSLVTKHSYTGDTLIEAGTLQLGANDLISSGSKVIIKTGATFDLGGKSQTANTLSLDGGTLKNGSLKGAITSSGGMIDSVTGISSLTLQAGTDADNPQVTTLAGANNFGAITVNTKSKLVVTGDSAATSATIHVGGELQIGATNVAGALKPPSGSSSISVKNGGIVRFHVTPANNTNWFDDAALGVDDLSPTEKGTVIRSGSAYFVVYGKYTNTGDTILEGGHTWLQSDDRFSQNSRLIVRANFNLNNHTQRTDDVRLEGGDIRNGVLVGAITSTGGTLWRLTGGASLSLASGETRLEDANTFGAITIKDKAKLVVTGSTTDSSVTVETGGTLQLGDGTTDGSVSTDITNGGTVIFNNKDAQSWGKVVSNNGTAKGAFTKSGAGELTISAVQTYTGATTVSAGTLKFGVDQALSSSSAITITGGALDLNSKEAQLNVTLNGGTLKNGTLKSSSTLTSNGGTINGVTATDTDVTLSAGSDAVTRTTRLTGTNSLKSITTNYNTALKIIGTTTLGTDLTLTRASLELGDGTTNGVLDRDIVNNGAVTFNNGTDQTFNNVISGGSYLAKAAAGKLTFTKAQTYAGGTSIFGGTLVLGVDDGLKSGSAVNVQSGALDLGGKEHKLSISLNGAAQNASKVSNGRLKAGSTISLSNTKQGTLQDITGEASVTTGMSTGLILNGSNQFASLNINGSFTLNDATKTTEVTGNAAFDTRAIYAVTVAPDRAALLNVSGGGLSITAGAKLAVTVTSALNGPKSYKFITTRDGVTGTFTVDGIAGYKSALGYVGKDVWIALLSNNTAANWDITATKDLNGGFEAFDSATLNGGTLKNGAIGRFGSNGLTSKGGTIEDVFASTIGLSVDSGTTLLNGTNTFASILVKDGATLTSNDATKTTTATGNVTFNANSTYKVTITQNSASLLDVKGALSIDAAAKLVVNASGTGFVTKDYIIAKSGSAIDRAFADGNVTLNNLANFTATTELTGSNKELTLKLVANLAQQPVNWTITAQAPKDLGGQSQAFDTALLKNGTLSNGTITSKQGNALESEGGTIDGVNGSTVNLTIKSNQPQTTLKGTNSFANITLENGGMLGISGKTTATSVSLGTNAFLDIGTQGVDGLLVSDVSSSGEIQWHTTSNATYDGVISGSGTFAKYSSGTLTFSKAQTYTGATTIDGGTLKLAAAQGLSADSAVTINARGTLDLGGTGHHLTVTLNGGTLTSGQLIEGGADDHTVASRITANGGRITDVIGNADLSLAAAQEGVFTTTLSGTNAFHKITIGSNALGIVTGETSIVESITVESNGALQMGDGTTNGLVKKNVTNNGAVIFKPKTNQTYDYVISGGGSLTKEGTADLTFNKAQTYSGGTTINGGKLILTTVNGLAADSVVTINRGATLDLGGKTQKLSLVTLNNGTLTSGKLNAGQNEAYDVESDDGVVHNVSAEGAGTVKLKAKSGATTLTGTNSFSAVTVAANATLELGDGTTDGSLNSDIANDGTVVFNTKNDQSWSKVVSNNDGVGKFVKEGAGKLTISAKQTYTGSTTINAGEMLLDVDQALSRASDITVAGGILTVNGTNIFASVLVKSGATWVANDATKTTTVNGNVTFNANATYKINVTADDASKLDIKGGLNIDAGAKLIVNAIGDGFVTKDYTIATTSDGVDSAFADANVTLNNLANFTAKTVLINGNKDLQLELISNVAGDNGAGGSGDGGTLAPQTVDLVITNTKDLNAGTQAFDTALLKGGTLKNGTIASKGGAALESEGGTIDGVLGGVNLLAKSGATNIAGTSTFANVTISNGATVTVANSTGQKVRLTSVTINAGGTLTFGTATNYFYVDRNAPTVQIASGGTVRVNMKDNQLDDYFVISDLSPTAKGSFIKSGAGNLEMWQAHSYTGDTTIEAGMLIFGDNNRFNRASRLIVQSGGTIELNGKSQASDTVQLQGGTIQNGNIDGAITSTGGLLDRVKGGANLTLLAGADANAPKQTQLKGSTTLGQITIADKSRLLVTGVTTNTSVTVETGGNLQLGDGTSDGSVSTDITDNGTVNFNNKNAQSWAKIVSGTGTLTKTGAGTLTISAKQTYTGATTVNAGEMVLDVDQALSSSSALSVTGGTLTVNGANTFASLAVSANATFKANDAMKTTTVTGNVTFDANSNYVITITQNASSKLSVGGSINVTNAKLTVNAQGTGFVTKDYTFITSTGGVTGNFNQTITLNNLTGFKVSTKIENGNKDVILSLVSDVSGDNGSNNNSNSGGNNTGGNNSSNTGGSNNTNNGGSNTSGNNNTNSNNSSNNNSNSNSGGTNNSNNSSGGNNNSNTTPPSGGTLVIAQTDNVDHGNQNKNYSTITFNGGTLSNSIVTTEIVSNGGTLSNVKGDNTANKKPALKVKSGTTTIAANSVNEFASVEVSYGATLINKGRTTDDLTNAGTVTNEASYSAKVLINTGLITNKAGATWTGEMVDNQSTVVNDGTWTGAFTQSGGRLSGIGSITGNVTINGGTFAPGSDTAGTKMTINGDLKLGSNATYLVTLDPSSTTSVDVKGKALIDGTLTAFFKTGSYVTKNYDILVTRDGVTGTFKTVNKPANMTADVDYADTNKVVLKLTANLTGNQTKQDYQSNVPVDTMRPTGNQLNVARALDSFFNNGGKLPSEYLGIYGLSGEALRNGLAQLSGEVSTGAQTSAFTTANRFMRIASDPLNMARQREVVGPDTVLWGALLGGVERIAGDNRLGAGTHVGRSGGFAVGADFGADADTIFGLSVAGASSSWNTRGMGRGTMESFQLAAYGRRSFGALDVTASLGFGQHWIGTDRTTFQQRGVSADFTGQTVTARVETGYRFTENWRGFVAMQGQRFTAQGFTEKGMAGDNFILTTGDQSGAQNRMEIGGRFEDIFRMPDGRQLFLRSQIAWARSHTSTPDVHSGFATLVGSRFTVSGTSAGPDALAIATSLDLPLSKAIAIGARVDGEWTNNSRGVSGQASFSVRW